MKRITSFSVPFSYFGSNDAGLRISHRSSQEANERQDYSKAEKLIRSAFDKLGYVQDTIDRARIQLTLGMPCFFSRREKGCPEILQILHSLFTFRKEVRFKSRARED